MGCAQSGSVCDRGWPGNAVICTNSQEDFLVRGRGVGRISSWRAETENGAPVATLNTGRPLRLYRKCMRGDRPGTAKETPAARSHVPGLRPTSDAACARRSSTFSPASGRRGSVGARRVTPEVVPSASRRCLAEPGRSVSSRPTAGPSPPSAPTSDSTGFGRRPPCASCGRRSSNSSPASPARAMSSR